MQLEYFTLALGGMIIAFASTYFLATSNTNFTRGQLRKITSYFIYGALLFYAMMTTQFIIEIFNLYGTFFEVLKFIFLYFALIFFLLASYEIWEMSKALGFASKHVPKKLRKILES